MSYTPHARIVISEKVQGQSREPTTDELIVLDSYREVYRLTFGEWPAGRWRTSSAHRRSVSRRAGLPQDPQQD